MTHWAQRPISQKIHPQVWSLSMTRGTHPINNTHEILRTLFAERGESAPRESIVVGDICDPTGWHCESLIIETQFHFSKYETSERTVEVVRGHGSTREFPVPSGLAQHPRIQIDQCQIFLLTEIEVRELYPFGKSAPLSHLLTELPEDFVVGLHAPQSQAGVGQIMIKNLYGVMSDAQKCVQEPPLLTLQSGVATFSRHSRQHIVIMEQVPKIVRAFVTRASPRRAPFELSPPR